MKKYLLISKLENGIYQILFESDSLSTILDVYTKWNKIIPLTIELDIFQNYSYR